MKRLLLPVALTLLLPFKGFTQSVTNGSVTGAPPANSGINAGNAPGWTGCGFSPDLCFTTLPSYLTTSAVPPAVSPDGGTWLGLAALGECARTTITGLTVGSVYTLYFCGACFGTGALYNSSPATPQILIGATTYSPTIPMVGLTWNGYSTTFTATATSMVLQARHMNGSNAYASLDGFNLAGPCGVILPATISNFFARPELGTVSIDWTLSAAQDPFSIELQRGIHGGDWESVAWFDKVDAASPHDFHWVDLKPYRGQSFYRLAFTDLNGAVSYSTLQEVNVSALASDQLLYPNPATDMLYLNIEGIESPLVELYDMEGQRMEVGVELKDQLMEISLEGINPGMYFVRITAGDQVIRRLVQVE